MLNSIGVILGIAVIFVAIINYLYRLYIIKNRIEVEAKVIRFRKSTGGEGGTVDSPVFQYFVDGAIYERTFPSSSSKHVLDSVVVVYCHKSNPKRSLLPDQLTKDLFCDIICLLTGVFVIYISIFH